jgi:hypothetical protein
VALLSNSTLRHLELGVLPHDDPGSLSPVFAALLIKKGIKNLVVGVRCSTEESLCAAMQDGLGMNKTL